MLAINFTKKGLHKTIFPDNTVTEEGLHHKCCYLENDTFKRSRVAKGEGGGEGSPLPDLNKSSLP